MTLVIPLPSETGHKNSEPDIQLEEKAVPQTPADENEDVVFTYEQIAGKIEEPPGRKLVWFIDIWLYPVNLAGIIHLICTGLLVFVICPFVMNIVGLGMEFIPIVYTLPVAYVLYYFTECIRDSANGHFRMPDYWMHPGEGKWDCISQLLIVLGCIAISFCPVTAYYIVTGKIDLFYWMLLALSGFFAPMVLLAAVLFDSFNALNPLLIIGSIARTFLPYCCMVLLLFGGALLFIKTGIKINLNSFYQILPLFPFMLKILQLYLLFMTAGLLGRFYCKYSEKLNWEV